MLRSAVLRRLGLKRLGELGGVINKTTSGRENDEEITLFKSVGLAIQDLSCARLVYDLALEGGVGNVGGPEEQWERQKAQRKREKEEAKLVLQLEAVGSDAGFQPTLVHHEGWRSEAADPSR